MNTVPITPEMIAAWHTLQNWARAVRAETYPQEIDLKAAKAIDVLDNANWMVPIERAEEEREATEEEISAYNREVQEHRRRHGLNNPA